MTGQEKVTASWASTAKCQQGCQLPPHSMTRRLPGVMHAWRMAPTPSCISSPMDCPTLPSPRSSAWLRSCPEVDAHSSCLLSSSTALASTTSSFGDGEEVDDDAAAARNEDDGDRY